MNDLGVRAELGRAVNNAVVEARAYRKDHVRMVHGQVGGVTAVHPQHAEELAIHARKATQPHQGIGHWHIEQLSQLGQGRSSAAHDDAATGVDDWPLSRQQHLGRFANLAGMTAHSRAVGAQLGLFRVDVFELLGRISHILGDIDHNRTRTT